MRKTIVPCFHKVYILGSLPSRDYISHPSLRKMCTLFVGKWLREMHAEPCQSIWMHGGQLFHLNGEGVFCVVFKLLFGVHLNTISIISLLDLPPF